MPGYELRPCSAITQGVPVPAGAVCGLRDPLPEVTHGLRSDEEKTKKRLFGRSRTTRHTVDMLLTPELLVVADRDGGADGADDEVKPAVQVGFHGLDQLDFAAAPAELLARVTGTAMAVPEGLLPVTSTPVGSTRRSTRYVPIGTGPDVAAFRHALMAAVRRSRHGAGA